MLKEKQRSYYGLGWEYARHGKKLGDNPFSDKDRYCFEQFAEGFNSYRKREKADYSDVTIDISRFPAPDNKLAEVK